MISLSQPTPKRFINGTHRSRAPEETLADFGRLMPKMGITRLANVTGLDRLGLPVVVAVRPNARSLSTSQGKGETLIAAKVSALMEAIEGWHAERIDKPLLHASYRGLCQTRAAVDPAQLPARRDTILRDDRPLMWIEGHDLVQQQRCWVPFDAVSTNFVFQPGTRPLFNTGSNGLSSGNSISEAIVHGLCEVIERDALALWEAVGRQAHKHTQVDLATVTDPQLRALLDALAARNVIVAAWSVTSDIGLPTYKALIADDPDAIEWRRISPMSGSGTHLSPEVALSRAIHEAIQSRLTMITGSREDVLPSHFDRQDAYADDRRLLHSITAQPSPVRFGDVRPPVGETFEEDIRTILAKLQSVGVKSVVVVNLSQDKIGVPVVKVTIPGLEGPMHGLYQPGQRVRRLLVDRRAAA